MRRRRSSAAPQSSSPSAETCSVISALPACTPTALAASCTAAHRSPRSSASAGALSMRESSSMSLMSACSRSPCTSMISSISLRILGFAVSTYGSRSVSMQPRIAVSGVLSSCVALETNSDRSCSSRRICVMSLMTSTTPIPAPLSSRMGAETAWSTRSVVHSAVCPWLCSSVLRARSTS